MERRAALGQLCWPELSGRSVTLLVPLGATEQHGPHLPLDTDSRISTVVANQVADELVDETGSGRAVLAAPGINYGASGEHEGFAGTISLGHEALHLMLVEYGRSACRWADRLVFVNGHGGNGATVVSAVRRLRYEGRDVAWFPCGTSGGDAHAGITETSVLLHVSPSDVALSAAEVGNTAPIGTLLESMRSGGVAAVSANGVLGDPTGASAEHGADLTATMVGALTTAVRDWSVGETGRLG
ncbi:mycofactocin biosynthesis peptidyl-dipeptidase MftE [Gordonia sp. CPCC 206044]|uniref:mycofactocin biosynthesis peptidyl-dipeptidase MftE n=1 Tax=Gordonia sp. CPCC 206044 TaxID=3140793 RepID=UPI003AF3C348